MKYLEGPPGNDYARTLKTDYILLKTGLSNEETFIIVNLAGQHFVHLVCR